MSLYQRLRFLFASKESQARIVSSFRDVGRPVVTPANYEAFAKQGYNKNAVVYTAISKITTACKSINWVLYQKKSGRRANWTELENHPLLDLWDKPNPLQSRSSFIESVIGFYKISGNSYIEANRPGKDVRELWPVRPDKMRVVPGNNGYPIRYEFSYGGMKRQWEVDQVNLRADILHRKTFNPTNDWYGMSPLEAGLLSVDTYNAGSKWNLALLQNSARPSGVLQMKVSDANPRGELTDEQYETLKKEWDETYSGYHNAGRPAILEGGLQWQTIAISPKDMDFLESKNVSAQDVALIYGVPPEIIGLGQKTFQNYKEAKYAFYEETVIPDMDAFRNDINEWLTPAFGDNLYLDYDKDSIEALVEKREQKYTSLQGTSFLSYNEKRRAAGYDEVEGMDVFEIGGVLYTKDEFQFLEDEDTEDENDTEDTEDTENENDTEDAEDENDTEDEKSLKLFDTDYKSFNLLNDNERRKAWKAQNKLRQFYNAKMRRDLTKDFSGLAKRLGKIGADLEGQSDKVIEYALIKEITEWLPEMEGTMKSHIRKVLKEFGGRVIDEGKSLKGVETKNAQRKFDDFVNEYIERVTGDKISTISSTLTKRSRNIVKEWVAETINAGDTLPDLSKMLEAEFEGLSKTNAMRIARTEVAAASTNGSLGAVKSLGVPNMVKQWVAASTGDRRDDPNKSDHQSVDEINGEIPIDEKFHVEPDAEMDGPHDPSAEAQQVVNCACVLVYKQKGNQ